MARYHLNVDWTKATLVDDDGKAAFIPNVTLVDASGNPVNIGGGGSGSETTISNRATFWPETDTPLAASGTFNGGSRDVGAASPGPVAYAYFTAMVLADQVGTATIQRSADGTTWVDAASAAIAANTPLTLQVPVTARYHRVVVENGGTAQTVLSVSTSYTAT